MPRFALYDKDNNPIIETNAPIDDWTESELFYYLISTSVISPDEEFEDWKHNRTDMVKMANANWNKN